MGSKNSKKQKTLSKPTISSNFNYAPTLNTSVNRSSDLQFANQPASQIKPFVVHDPPLPAVLPITIYEINEHRKMPQMPLNFDI